MIYKEIPSHADEASLITFRAEEGINKVASFQTHIPPKLASLITEIQRNPDPNHAYLYDRALGAGEIYGCNNNGDWFGKDDLIRCHHTFEKNAKLYRHHQNKDPRNAIGDVLASDYNDKLDTVDLIIRAPIEKIASDLDAFENRGKLIQTSMGAKVPFDECSECGNKARTRAQYCHHLRFQMKRLMPSGRQVFARNPNPNFVDISMVVIRAAPESAILRKIASLKSATMKKVDVGSGIGASRGAINPHLIEATTHLKPADALVTMHEAKGVLRPDEFQAILRKDASLIRPEIIPLVPYKPMQKRAMSGHVIEALVDPFQHVPNIIKTAAKRVTCDFLTREEMDMYLTYRASMGNFTTEFFT